MAEKKAIKKRRRLAILCCVVFFLVAVLGVLQIGSWSTEKAWDYWYPTYAKEDIQPLLEQGSLSEEEYDFLYRQTGLTKLAIDDMRFTEAGRARILTIQRVFFANYPIEHRLFAPFTYMDEIDGWNEICDLQDGDIILSASTRVSWWRYGHACIVVDGANRVIAECLSPGTKSEMAGVIVCDKFCNFLVVRPKAEREVKKQVVSYVHEEMIGLPYRLTTGIFSKKFPEELKSSQCAHFVWYAYKKFGLDLDANGGAVVKPQDIAFSKDVELVQAFGFNLDTLWS